jgi:acyl-coenzyme A synthetase/AMP-(fatty) acid ligase
VTADGPRRCYRTGDRAVYTADGKLVFLGREDHQIKLRGFRIELGELESVIEEHPGISEAAAVVQHAEDAVRACISAFAVPAEEVSPGQIRKWLAERLPSSMLPRAVHLVPSLPRTEGGKVDRGALTSMRISDLAANEFDKFRQ